MKLHQNHKLAVSLVIPMKNEKESLAMLIESIKRQTAPPDEIILVDGGSNDGTVSIAEKLAAVDPSLKLIKTPEASPGKGRNIGTENARNEWIAYTDAGINLADDWLAKLTEKVLENNDIDLVYGNYAPIRETFFEKIASLAYVAPQKPNTIRGRFIASSLVRKKVWSAVGGFPDRRAAEDLIFMEEAEKLGFKPALAPAAMVYWQLRPDVFSTFRKFVLYSKHNVWAGRAWDWHYGILKQYLILLPFILLMSFHSWWWSAIILLWLFVRTLKRVLPHRYEFGAEVLSPTMFFGTMFLILLIDAATFIGWGQALLQNKASDSHN